MTDLEIAQKAKIINIKEIAKKINLSEDDIEYYGKFKAKLSPDLKSIGNRNGKVILVTAINPTPAGEGKSTTTIGLGDALNKLNKNPIICLREPSFGPVLGIKGGAAGGGYAQVIPMEDINLHFTGDIHAITTANNTVSAILDNSIKQGNILNIDPTKVVWHRTLDMNDRSLRNIIIGLGGTANGIPREDHFDISVASEIMAIMCLSNDLNDFKNKVKKAVVAYTYSNKPVTIDDLGISGALTMIMKDCLKPNLVQTLEHTPTIIHGGPFANIAHGCNSIIATNMARHLGDYVVTEAGFGADLGAEKFLDIKATKAGFDPSAVVIVATVRALKFHGGVSKTNLTEENVAALKLGIKNLEKHIENIKKYNLGYVVCVNKFATDTEAELNAITFWAKKEGHKAVISEAFAKGSDGAIELAKSVIEIVNADRQEFSPIYDSNDTVIEKINIISKEIYGASGVHFSAGAIKELNKYKEFGWDKLPVCMAKTQYSLSDDQTLLGRPSDFIIEVREVKPSIGAGFIVAICGNVMTMPGLPKHPAALDMDVIDDKITGLF